MNTDIQIIIQRANSFLNHIYSEYDRTFAVDPKLIEEDANCYILRWCYEDQLSMPHEIRTRWMGVGALLSDKKGLMFELCNLYFGPKEFELLIKGLEIASLNITYDEQKWEYLLEVFNFLKQEEATKEELLLNLNSINELVITNEEEFPRYLNYQEYTGFSVNESKENYTFKTRYLYKELPQPNYPIIAIHDKSVFIIKNEAENYKLLDIVIPQKELGHVVAWDSKHLYHNKSFLENGELVSLWVKKGGENLVYIKSLLSSKKPYSIEEENMLFYNFINSCDSFEKITTFLIENKLEVIH
ncbi:MAG: hypothetical protein HRT68_02865 [Flavobacteriaceae bacterium]|nr:hypothetical protein [Flavobacteriaceae bacterium]